MSSISRGFAVVHVAETIKGGITSYLRYLLPLQVSRFGMGRVAIVVPEGQAEELRSCVGVVVYTFKRSRSRIYSAVRARVCLNVVLRQFGANVVHIHSTMAGITCRAPMFPVKHADQVFYCPHGWSFIRAGGSRLLEKFLERLLCRRCDAIVCVSLKEKEIALEAGLPPGKLTVVLSGLPDLPIPLSQPVSRSDGTLRLVFAGRFDEAKGFDVLQEALERVQRLVEVDVFGESVLGDMPAAVASKRSRLHGWQPFAVIADALAAADALVVPSRWEAFSLAAVEAMRAGKAVIGSRVGGLAEVVLDGVTGILVDPNDPSALARAMDSLTPEMAAEMGIRGRERFLSLFRIERTEQELADLYLGVRART